MAGVIVCGQPEDEDTPSYRRSDEWEVRGARSTHTHGFHTLYLFTVETDCKTLVHHQFYWHIRVPAQQDGFSEEEPQVAMGMVLKALQQLAIKQGKKKSKVMSTYPSVVMVTMVYQKEAGMEVKVEPLVPFSA